MKTCLPVVLFVSFLTVCAIQELNHQRERNLPQKEMEIAEMKARLEKRQQRVNQDHEGER